MPKSENSQDALIERKLFRLLRRLADEFEIERGQVVLRQPETERAGEPGRQDVLGRRLFKLIRQMPELLAQMSHRRFAEYVPILAALAKVVRPLDYGARDLWLGATTRESLSRVKAAEKEPWTVGWIEREIAAGDVFYDIGANVGAYSLIAARAAGATLRVYAFEPSFSTYAALVENIARNGLASQINAFPVVLTREAALVSFQYLGLSAGAAQHAVDSRPLAGRERAPVDPVMTQMIPGFALDGFRDLFGTPQPNHVKIDVDGHELAVLEGGRRTWASADLKSVMIETEGQAVLDESEAFLREQAGLNLAERWEKPAVTYSLYRRE